MAADDATASLLAAALAKASPKRVICGVELAKQEHPALADQIDELNAAWPRVQFSIQEATLKDAGIVLRADTLSRHHRGKCSCQTDS